MAQVYVAYKKILIVAENLAKRAESLRKNSVSRSTLKTRRKQWACYEKICKKFGNEIFVSNKLLPDGNFFPQGERLFCGRVVRYVSFTNCKGH